MKFALINRPFAWDSSVFCSIYLSLSSKRTFFNWRCISKGLYLRARSLLKTMFSAAIQSAPAQVFRKILIASPTIIPHFMPCAWLLQAGRYKKFLVGLKHTFSSNVLSFRNDGPLKSSNFIYVTLLLLTSHVNFKLQKVFIISMTRAASFFNLIMINPSLINRSRNNIELPTNIPLNLKWADELENWELLGCL